MALHTIPPKQLDPKVMEEGEDLDLLGAPAGATLGQIPFSDGVGGTSFGDLQDGATATATAGQVLEADGIGGAAFVTPSFGAHQATHQDGGADELPADTLAESAAPANIVTQALRPNGTGGVAWSDVAHVDTSGIGADDHHTENHRARHISAGADAFLSTDILEAVVKRLQTTSGPTILTMGALLGGQGLVRNGSGIVGFNYTYVKTSDNLVSLLSGAANGETFILESGTHNISAPIAIGASLFNVSIIGARGSIIKGTGASITSLVEIGTTANGLRLEGFTFEVRAGDGNAIKVTGATDEVVIKDIMFIKEGPPTLAGSCIEFALGAGVNATKWTIEGCFASQGDAVNNWANFITTDTTTSVMSHFKVLNNTIMSTGILASSTGIRFLTSGGLNNSIIHGNTIKNVDVTGIQIQAGSNNRVTVNNILLGIDRGINIKSGTTIIGFNDVNGASDIGIAIEGNNCICDGNRTNDCATAIVLREGATRAVVSNNSILGGSGHDGIELRSAGGGVGDEHRIIGNVISGTDRGIELQDGEDVVISDNQILNLFAGASPLGVGIWLQSTNVRRVQIRDNYIEPNNEGILDESDRGFHTFQDNEIKGGTKGILVAAGFRGDGIVCKGNKIITTSSPAIEIWFDDVGPIVTENIIRGATGTGQGMLFKRNSVGDSRLIINDNHISECASIAAAIQVDDAHEANVDGNRIANNAGDGIRFVGANDSSASNNHITDQAGAGIKEFAGTTGCNYFGNKFVSITGLNLELLGTGAKTDLSLNPLVISAGATLPPNNAAWAVNALAPVISDSNDNNLSVAAFDDTIEEGRGFEHRFDPDAQRFRLKLESRAETGPGAAQTARYKLYFQEILDNAAVGAYSAGTLLAAITIPITTEFFQFDEEEFSLATLGITPGRRVQFELTRLGTDASDTLAGDLILKTLTLVPV